MKVYNKQDVVLLEKIYLHFRPWMKSHPNVAVYQDGEIEDISCPKCGSASIQYRGYVVNATTKYRRFQCNTCGGWGRSRTNMLKGLKVTNA